MADFREDLNISYAASLFHCTLGDGKISVKHLQNELIYYNLGPESIEEL